MYMQLRNIGPKCRGLISQHQAERGFKALDETIESLVWMAMIDYPEQIIKLEQEIERLKNEEEGEI